MTRKPIFLLAFAFLLALAISLWPRDGQALPADKPVIQSGYDLLAAVNSLRASNGLPAYSANAILMQIAQAQADYLAATGGASGHIGPGGTTAKQRATAAGYAWVFFSENFHYGMNMSPAGAVSVWQGDYEHLNTMLSANMIEAGGGVSNAGGMIYYVLDAGAPSNYTGAPTVTPGGPTVTPVTPGTPIVSQFMVPVTINTPDASGMVYHEVAYGQALSSIAVAYNTTVESIKQLNNLNDNMIYVGQKLLVMRGATPAPSITPSLPASPISVASATALPASMTPFLSTAATNTVTPTKTAAPSALSGGRFNVTALAIILGALAFAALGTWLGTRKAA